MIVVPGQHGRLGSRLQLAAHVAAVARECDRPALLGCLDGYAEMFRGPGDDALRRFPATDAPERGGLAARLTWTGYAVAARLPWPGVRRLAAPRCPGVRLDEPAQLAAIATAPTVVLCGRHFHAPALAARHAAAIRAYFQPVAGIRARIDAFLRAARRGRRILVGVHVRHGDFRAGPHFLRADQYARVMRRLADALAPAHFVVCSDARLPDAPFAGVSWERGPGRTVEDLYVLAGCDYLVGPPSAFGRWASFVGDVPRHELRDPSRPLALADFAPATWTAAP